ncbi:MAG: F0F1 ATP synthase subunit epsilon [Candidatus Coatesbacteria bacterium]|nr:F0F1 ATP synthase subunit epsilon [Candidatus Coatesbacteria bacterium]
MEQEKKLSLDIVTPHVRVVFAKVDEVNVPGSEGDFGVLPEHTPFLASVRPGVLSYRQQQNVRYFAVSTGFAEVLPDRVIVLLQAGEDASRISEKRAQDSRERALRRLESATKGDQQVDVKRAELSLARANARLRACAYLKGKR